jgi:hypothetical protein
MNVSLLLSVSINALKLIQISNVLQVGAVFCVVEAQAKAHDGDQNKGVSFHSDYASASQLLCAIAAADTHMCATELHLQLLQLAQACTMNAATCSHSAHVQRLSSATADHCIITEACTSTTTHSAATQVLRHYACGCGSEHPLLTLLTRAMIHEAAVSSKMATSSPLRGRAAFAAAPNCVNPLLEPLLFFRVTPSCATGSWTLPAVAKSSWCTACEQQ